MNAAHRYWVGPLDVYDIKGALQFCLLATLGLREHHFVLDVACGSLRAGRLLIPFLLPGHYYGLEREKSVLDAGIEQEVGREVVERKQATFRICSDFDFSGFGHEFDFIIAHAILFHITPAEVHKCFAEASKNLSKSGLFLFNFAPGEYGGGDTLVYPTIARHSPQFMFVSAQKNGLEIVPLSGFCGPAVSWAVAKRPGRLIPRLDEIRAALPVLTYAVARQERVRLPRQLPPVRESIIEQTGHSK